MKLKDMIIGVLIYCAICGLWQGLELIFYGEVQTKKVDNIIGLILLVSLLGNYQQHKYAKWLEKKFKERETNG